jgi:hypothetical protein
MLQTALLLSLLLNPNSFSAPVGSTTGDALGGQPGVAVRTPQVAQDLPAVHLERLDGGIPWPRGIAFVEDKFVVLARGRHRNAGGAAADFEDFAGTLFWVDPDIYETYEPGAAPSERILGNQRVLAAPDPEIVHLYDRTLQPLEDMLMNRPYCALAYDAVSQNLFMGAFAGVDLGEAPGFRKNATDAIYRYDLRTGRWGVVELHRDDVVPLEARTHVIPNQYYPHHDPAQNPAPHGWLNGTNSMTIVGNWLYASGKDNHTLARYDLSEIRRDPNAGPPRSEYVLGERVRARVLGEEQDLLLQGHSGLGSDGKWLYLGTRTNSVVVRFPVTPEGDLVQPVVGELIAEFEPWSDEDRRSADLWELEVDPKGRLLVANSRAGRVWRFTPDPMHPFDGNDRRTDPPTVNRPYIDLPALTGIPRARVSNMAFDAQGRLVFCATMREAHTNRAGGVFRVIELED